MPAPAPSASQSPWSFLPLPAYGLDSGAELLTRAFSDYFVKIAFTPDGLLQLARTDSVDLTASRVVLRDGVAAGAALIARRGWTSRLAGMALLPEARRQGAGRALVQQVLAEAKARGERTMVLEVIEQNEPAVKLYVACGFTKVRRLVGFIGRGEGDAQAAALLQEFDPRVAAAMVTAHGRPDLPWQLSGETLSHVTPPSVAYRLENSWVILSGVAGPQVAIRALVTERNAQGRGQSARLLRAAMARHPGKEWRMTAIWPEELGDVFVGAGLARLDLSQWQMKQELAGDKPP